jgi:methionyl-tRNA formyltransferase
MMGTGTFARPTFEAILAETGARVVGLVTQPDRDGGQQRGSTRLTGATLKDIAIEHGLEVYQPESVNTPEGVAQLDAWQPDLLVVAAYGQILKNEILQAARWGGINVHGSLLPRYRGAAPVAHAILNGETMTGVTIIRMTTGLDAGDMLAQDSLEIGPEETAGELEGRLAPLGAKLALEVIRRAASVSGLSALPATKQDPSLVTKAPKLKKENGLIDWTQSAERIACHVRAMPPWPTAYTFLHHLDKPALRVIVQKVKAMNQPPTNGPHAPGAIAVLAGSLCVNCGMGWIEIAELQPAGKKAMTAAEFLRGHPVQDGDWFGAEKE